MKRFQLSTIQHIHGFLLHPGQASLTADQAAACDCNSRYKHLLGLMSGHWSPPNMDTWTRCNVRGRVARVAGLLMMTIHQNNILNIVNSSAELCLASTLPSAAISGPPPVT